MKTQRPPAPQTVLAQSACHVLETAAFAFAEPASDEDLLCFDSGYAATVNLSGDLTGVFTLAATGELCHALAADIVGMDAEEISWEQSADALGELANIIAGRLVTDWLGEDVIVKLDPPRRRILASQDWDQLRQRGTALVLLVEDQPMLVDFTLPNELSC